MIRIDVSADFKEVEKMFRELGPGVERAAVRALNKTARAIRAQAARKIQQERNLKIGVIKKSLNLSRARKGRLVATITASGKPIPIRHFGARQSRLGVSVKIRKGGKLVRLRRHGNKAFINASSKLGPNVFVRKGRSRLPVQKWPPVPGIPSVFAKEKIISALKRSAGELWQKRFREEVRFEIRKAERRARSG